MTTPSQPNPPTPSAPDVADDGSTPWVSPDIDQSAPDSWTPEDEADAKAAVEAFTPPPAPPQGSETVIGVRCQHCGRSWTTEEHSLAAPIGSGPLKCCGDYPKRVFAPSSSTSDEAKSMDGTRWQGITPKQAVEKLEERLSQAHHDENKLRADLTAARLALEEARREADEAKANLVECWNLQDAIGAVFRKHFGEESIEAENISNYSKVVEAVCWVAKERTTQRDAALADAERLRETVKNAPHAEGCVMLDVWPHNDRCTCWKSAALNPAEPKL